jgi:outer membrane protein TolC
MKVRVAASRLQSILRAAGILLSMLVLIPHALGAQATPLTLDEAVRMALAKNERALIAEAQFSASDARVAKARAYFMPGLNATGTYTRRPEEVTRTIGGQRVVAQSVNALSGVAALNLTIFDSRGIPGVRQVRFERNAAESAAAESKRQLTFEVSQAFLATLGTEQVLEASKRRYEFARENLAAAKARYDAGLVSVNDVTRAELEFATAEMGVTQIKGQTETTYLELGYLLDDKEIGARALVSPEFLIESAPVDSASTDSFVIEAQNRRLDLDALRWHAKAERALLMEPILRWLPSLAVTSQYRYTNEAGLSGQSTTWNAGLTLNWAIFDGFARNADYGEQKALVRVAELDVTSALRRVDVDVRNAIVSLSSQRASLREASVAGEVARKNATETTALYRQGIASALEAADANVRLFEAEVALAQERYGLAVAYLNFEAALGLDPFGKEPQR